MKKQYMTPAIKAVKVSTPKILAGSPDITQTFQSDLAPVEGEVIQMEAKQGGDFDFDIIE